MLKTVVVLHDLTGQPKIPDSHRYRLVCVHALLRFAKTSKFHTVTILATTIHNFKKKSLDKGGQIRGDICVNLKESWVIMLAGREGQTVVAQPRFFKTVRRPNAIVIQFGIYGVMSLHYV